jgi:hypothetical protein
MPTIRKTAEDDDDDEEEDWDMTLNRYPKIAGLSGGRQLAKLRWPSVTIAARLRHCLCKEHDRGGGDRSSSRL